MLRCELLSIWLLLWISHSKCTKSNKILIVVNCFQFDYFCGYHTAILCSIKFRKWLWIAFNLITFVDITQRDNQRSVGDYRCELLSIWLLLWISHSPKIQSPSLLNVVNCFQFDYFCGYHTALRFSIILIYMLWIAFNLITFVDITQLRLLCYIILNGCELLSIWLLLWISHSGLYSRKC